MTSAAKFVVFLALTLVVASSAQKSPKHSPNRGDIETVGSESYEVYSALLTERYRGWLSRNMLKIAAYTTAPDRDHGDLFARCVSGAQNETDRELIRRVLTVNTHQQRLEAKLTLPGRYSIVEGKVDIREGTEPGIVWVSAVSFSEDRRHAMVWMRNVCGGLCGSGLMWKLDRTAKGWQVINSVPNCGFIS